MFDSFVAVEGYLTGCPFGTPEILQRGYHIQADEPPKHRADRGRRPRSIPLLHGIKVDGEWEYVELSESVPRTNRPFGAGE